MAKERYILGRVRMHDRHEARQGEVAAELNHMVLTPSLPHKTDTMRSSIYYLVTGIVAFAVSMGQGQMLRNLTEADTRKKINIVGNNGGPNFPLGLCEGDCDSDHDCKDGLVCYQRRANEPVPGCRGGHSDNSQADYCVPKQEGPTDDHEEEDKVEKTGPFFLKMFWREGFRWEHSKWCMKCHHGRCLENREIYLEKCNRHDSLFKRGPTKFKFVHVNDAVQIRIVTHTSHWHSFPLCLERRGHEVRVEKCDKSRDLQLFVSPRGRTNGKRFELAPLSDDSLCMTQRHGHPERNQKLELVPCQTARRDQTSLWSRYDR